MAKTIGYSVISSLEEGFLHQSSPSVWHYDIATAIRYETEKQAWAAANRRKFALAAAVRVFHDDAGKLDFEQLKPADSAIGGNWIVIISIGTAPGVNHYVTSAGKRISISNASADARGFATEKSAQRAADMVNQINGWSARLERVTAEIMAFKSRQ